MQPADRIFSQETERPPARLSRLIVAQLFLSAMRHWQRTQAINELAELDDRQRAHIGVARSEIPDAVAGRFRADRSGTNTHAKWSRRVDSRTSADAYLPTE